jgi:hypothetical protein
VDYRRLCKGTEISILVGFFEEHRVVALHHGTVKGPSFALADKVGRRRRRFLWHPSLLLPKLDSVGNGLKSRSGHVEQHFSQMGASLNTANVGIYGSSPSSAQGATY